MVREMSTYMEKSLYKITHAVFLFLGEFGFWVKWYLKIHWLEKTE